VPSAFHYAIVDGLVDVVDPVSQVGRAPRLIIRPEPIGLPSSISGRQTDRPCRLAITRRRETAPSSLFDRTGVEKIVDVCGLRAAPLGPDD